MTSAQESSDPGVVQLWMLEATDLQRVSEIHLAAFPDSALTLLGAEAVRRYYEWLLTGPHECVALGASVDEDILIGFCFGGVFRGALSGFLGQNRAFLFRRTLIRPWLGMNPLFRERAASGFRILRRLGRQQPAGAPGTPTFPKPKTAVPFGILGIAVHPEAHGQGVGTALMAEAERTARRGEFKEMQLTVQMSNQQAISFYEGLNWEKTLDQGTWHGEMRKTLRA
jgi:ribosomal protein S18 acetylase RimI-like enzyme